MNLPSSSASPAPAGPLSAIYPEALPAVYGYLVRRCGSIELAEDLTSSTFVAAASGVRRGVVEDLSVPWLRLPGQRWQPAQGTRRVRAWP